MLVSAEDNPQVYLFGTCLIDVFYPEYGMDSAALLKLCGYEVILPPAQTCCGQPPYNSGHLEQARPVVKQAIDTFSQERLPLIVPSASCAAMIKHHYPALFDRDSEEAKRAEDLAGRTYELSEFLIDKLPYAQANPEPSANIALHQSCSARREMGVSQHWHTLLTALPGVEVNTPKYAEECCGFGGTFAIKSPSISTAMTEDKCEHLHDTACRLVVSGDCGCLMNLDGFAKQHNMDLSFQHLARFVAMRFGVHYVD